MYITRIKAMMDSQNVHHFLMIACNMPLQTDGTPYACKERNCHDEGYIMAGWGKQNTFNTELKIPEGMSMKEDPNVDHRW